jgi:hypothetical protein
MSPPQIDGVCIPVRRERRGKIVKPPLLLSLDREEVAPVGAGAVPEALPLLRYAPVPVPAKLAPLACMLSLQALVFAHAPVRLPIRPVPLPPVNSTGVALEHSSEAAVGPQVQRKI